MIRSIKKAGPVLLLMISSLALLNCGGDGGGGGGGSTAPGIPSGLKAEVSSNLVTLTWNASANAASYRVYRSTSPGLTKSTGTLQGTTTNTTFNNSAANGNTYYYVVTAVSGYLESASSAEVSARLTAPVPPATVLATAGNEEVSLSWSSSPNALSYSVHRSITTGTGYSQIASGLTTTSLRDSSLTNSTTYYYGVRAANSFGQGVFSSETSATPTSAPSATVTISGLMKYEDREYDQFRGHGGSTMFQAVRFAKVELVNASTLSVIATSWTDSAGGYVINVASSSVSGVTAYVRVTATARPATGQEINVRTVSASPLVYAVKSASFAPTGNTVLNLSIPVTNAADSAFNILDVMTSGFQMINSASTPTVHVMTLNTHWQPNNTDATYFCPPAYASYCTSGAGIYVHSDPFGSGDTDDFDDDVLWHELGHYIANALSKDDSLGGTHILNDNTQDMRLSWSEGWGTFFETAVKDWLYTNQPSLLSTPTTGTYAGNLSEYIDTEIGGYYISINISAPETGLVMNCSGDDCKYSTNEVSVSNVLWNLMSSNGTGKFGFQPIWKVMREYIPTKSNINLDTFWDGWLFQRNPGPPELATLDLVFYGNRGDQLGRLIDYTTDGYETDSAFATASSYMTAQNHTLYGAGDQDYIAFNATGTSRTITTGNLRNGADTVLTLYGPAPTYTLIATNDNITNPTTNENTTTALASRIVASSLSTGETYYVSVKSNTSTPKDYAGKYGSYRLTITP